MRRERRDPRGTSSSSDSIMRSPWLVMLGRLMDSVPRPAGALRLPRASDVGDGVEQRGAAERLGQVGRDAVAVRLFAQARGVVGGDQDQRRLPAAGANLVEHLEAVERRELPVADDAGRASRAAPLASSASADGYILASMPAAPSRRSIASRMLSSSSTTSTLCVLPSASRVSISNATKPADGGAAERISSVHRPTASAGRGQWQKGRSACPKGQPARAPARAAGRGRVRCRGPVGAAARRGRRARPPSRRPAWRGPGRDRP